MEKFKYKKRYLTINLTILFIFILLCYRLYQICYYKNLSGKTLDTIADSQYAYTERTNSLNYKVLDKNGENLLEYTKKYKAVIDPSLFSKNDLLKNKEQYDTLYYILKNYNKTYDIYSLVSEGNSKKIVYDVDEETYNKLKTIKVLKGFYIYEYSDVDKTNGNSIENIITNFTAISSNKKKTDDSMEKNICDNVSNNKYPIINYLRDVNGNITGSKEVLPEDNINVKLTIDKELENKIGDVLNQEEYKSFKDIGVILMESDTGNILTLTQKNNKRANVDLGIGTENGFCPGSIFKVIVEETALETGNLSTNKIFYCDANKNSLCKESHGYLNVSQAFALSCNNTFKQIGDSIKYEDLLKMAESQGIFSKVLNITGEKTGDIVPPKSNEGGNRLISIGQNMRITPIQALSIVNTVVTGGKYVKPKLIDSFLDSKNNVVKKENDYSKTVITQNTAEIIKSQMKGVVTYGTGTSAYVKGIDNGGKTGTSTWADENGKLHSDGWFIGYFTISNKSYSMVVFVKDIDMEKESGGNTAAPVFKTVVEAIKKSLQ